jgi:dTDP-glucose 4,6-dehydratase
VDRDRDVLLVSAELVGDLVVEAVHEGGGRHGADATCCLQERRRDGAMGRRELPFTLMPTCLVTGGAGFLGSHLCDELLRRGHRVICADNLETGSLANIAHIREPEFRFEQIDIIEPYFIDEPVDFVYHAASPASPIDYLRLPLHTLKVGSHGTHHTLGLAKRHRARFLIFSTSEVYGDPEIHPQPESYWGNVNPIGPRGVYDEAKRYAEALTMAYPPPAGRRHGDRAGSSTPTALDAPARRARHPDLPAPGALRSPDHDLRRRLADAQLHLRR